MTPHITLNFRVKGRLRLFTSHFSSGKKISSTISSMVAMETGSKVINHSCLTRSTGLSSYAGMLLLPLYYQQVRGQSVLASGLLLIPQGVGMLMTRSLAGKLTDTIGSRWVVLGGTILTLLGTLPFALGVADTSEVLLAISLIVRGGGLGGLMLPIMATAYEGLSKELIPHASSATGSVKISV